jgi:hypothetical protein
MKYVVEKLILPPLTSLTYQFMGVSILLSNFSLNRLATRASVVALSAGLALFAQPSQKASAEVALSGSGATSIETLVNDWFTSRGVNYRAIGSGAGRAEFENGITDFVSTDLTLPNVAEVVVINPVNIPVGFVYNVPGFEASLSTQQVIDIVNGSITNWSELGGPDLPITFVYRSDSSGTTTILNSFLNRNGGGNVSTSVGIGATGSSGIISTVRSTEGAIGYVDIPAARQAGASLATLDASISGANFIVFRRRYGNEHLGDAARNLCLYLTGSDAAQIASNLGYEVASTDPTVCNDITPTSIPPVEQPPVEQPPVEQPPVEPPVETPVETPVEPTPEPTPEPETSN